MLRYVLVLLRAPDRLFPFSTNDGLLWDSVPKTQRAAATSQANLPCPPYCSLTRPIP